MKKYLIYILTFPNDKVYIGQTNKFKGRMSCYKNLWCKQQPKLFNALKKYGWENINKEILLECNVECADFFERALISGYNSMHKNYGYNLESGGNKNKIMSSESRQKMRNSQLGKKHSEEFKLKQSKRMSGKNHFMYGKKHSEESKEK